jgi:hypothetical protein
MTLRYEAFLDEMEESPDGDFLLFSDHEAALAKARKEGREEVREWLAELVAEIDCPRHILGFSKDATGMQGAWEAGMGQVMTLLDLTLLATLTKEGD